jgi:hypothetical protein
MIQVLNGEVDVAVVNNDFQRALDNASWYDAIGSGDLRVLPSYLVPIAPIFNLPVSSYFRVRHLDRMQ